MTFSLVTVATVDLEAVPAFVSVRVETLASICYFSVGSLYKFISGLTISTYKKVGYGS